MGTPSQLDSFQQFHDLFSFIGNLVETNSSMEKKSPQFSISTNDNVDEQFRIIIESIHKNMPDPEIMKSLHEKLVNRVIPTISYNESHEGLILYRITKIKGFNDFNPKTKSHYSYPPEEYCKRQRVNLPRHPVMYTSIYPTTALAEMKGSIEVGEKFYISQWKLNFKERLVFHDLTLNSQAKLEGHILHDYIEPLATGLRNIISKVPQQFSEGLNYPVEKLGDLFTTPNEDYYHITSAYSHLMLYNMRKIGVKFDAITYPSVQDNSSLNIAFHPTVADSDLMQLEQVFEVTMVENTLSDENGGVKINIHKRGIFGDQIFIRWEAPFVKITNIFFEGLKIKTFNGEHLNGIEAANLYINNSKATVKDYVKAIINAPEFINNLPNERGNDEPSEPLSIDVKHYQYEFVQVLKHGIKVQTSKGLNCIEELSIPLKWIKEYQESK